MKKKNLIVSIIAVVIFCLTSFPTSIGIIMENEAENQASSDWQTYRCCLIRADFYGDTWPNTIWAGPFPFFKSHGLKYATISGWKGEKEPSEIIGFGFRGFIFPYIEPRYFGSIEGYFRFCLYKE